MISASVLSSRAGPLVRQTQRRTHGSTSSSSDGDRGPARCVIQAKMTAPTMTPEDSTPRSGESLSNSSINYERLARDLLIDELEFQAYEIRDLYFQVARTLKDGGDLGAEELHKLQSADARSRDLVQLVKESIEDNRDGGDSR